VPFDTTLVIVLLILFVSTLVRAVFGFGNALIAMPLLAMTSIGMKTATPLTALIASLIAISIIASDWRTVDLKSTWRLLIGTIPGIPFGLLLLKGAYEDTIKLILALVIISFSAYSLLKPRLISMSREWIAYPFGFIAGILGGAYNSNGPPIVIYGALSRWPADRFRATLQGYFLPANLFIMASHALGGLWTSTVGWYFLISLPVTVVSIWIGNHLNRKIPQGRFDRYVHLLLLMIGSLLLFQTLIAGNKG
jgi:uncharacterized membrane protein YfcA